MFNFSVLLLGLGFCYLRKNRKKATHIDYVAKNSGNQAMPEMPGVLVIEKEKSYPAYVGIGSKTDEQSIP